MAEILKKQAQLFIDAFPDVDRKSPVIPEGGKIDFCKQANITIYRFAVCGRRGGSDSRFP